MSFESTIEMLRAQTRAQPERPAIVAPHHKPLTYRSLLAHVEKLGASLRQAGLKRGDTIAISLPNGPEMATAFLAVGSVCTAAPLNPSLGKVELDFYLADLEANALLVARGVETPAVAAASKLSIPVLEVSTVEGTDAGVFTLGEETSRLLEDGDWLGPDDIALMLHTSGTTSRPKLVPLSHRGLCRSASNIAHTLSLEGEDRCLNVMPLFHIHGLIGAFLSSMSAGASVACCPDFDASRFFQWIDACDPTWYTAVPTMHQAVLAAARDQDVKHRLRLIRSSSSALPVGIMEAVEKRFGVPVIESYGMTEASHQIASNPLPPAARKPGSVGVSAGPEIAIADAEGNFLQQGRVGEIVIRGDNVTGGYAADPEANRTAFFDGWFRTGDQGYCDEEGYLFISGRLKEIINRGGEKVSPSEVDEALLTHPDVMQALCFAVPHPSLGEDVAVALVPREGSGLDEQEIRDFALQRLASFKVPSQVLVVSAIPQGPTGKLQRIGLAEKLSHMLRVEHVPPANAIQARLAAIWSELLRMETVGIRDHFFSLGGDSLLATRLLARAGADLGVALPADQMLRTPTLEGLEIAVRHAQVSGRSASRIEPRRSNGPHPLSFAQERLWFLEQVEGGLIGHHRPTNIRLRGPLDPGLLATTVNEIARRHSTLQTSFSVEHGRPVQRVDPTIGLHIERVDVRDRPMEEREGAARALATEAGRKPFNLAQPPLARVLLIRLDSEDHLLSFTFHHIVFDGWSQGVLCREIAEQYDALHSGRPADRAELPVQYSDFAAWQRDTLGDEALADGLAYWEKRLGEDPPRLELPLDFRRPPVHTYIGGRHPLVVPDDLHRALEALSRQEGVTLFTTLLAAYATLLHRYSTQEEIVIGCPVAGRNQAETENLVGMFINALPMKCDLSDDPAFTTLLERTRETAAGALLHQDVPIQHVVQHLLSGRDRSRSPLFQALFIYENMPPVPSRFADLSMEVIDIDIGTAQLDLSLELIETPEGCHGYFEYAADLFRPETIAAMTSCFMTLLEGVVTRPSHRLSQLPLLPPQASGAYVAQAPPPEVEERLVHELIEGHADKNPSAVAVCYEGRTLTYAELNERAESLAERLIAAGAGPGKIIALCLERGLDVPTAFLGVLKTGAAYLPLDPAYPAERLGFMLSDASVSVVVTQKHLVDLLPDPGVTCIWMDGAGSIGHGIQESHRPNAEDPAYVIYTSGSTGRPKGVVVTHANIVSAYQAWVACYGLECAPYTHLQTASFSFDVCTGDLVRALCSGGRLVLCPQDTLLDGKALFDLIEREGVDFAELSKGVAQNLLRHVSSTDQRLHTMRMVVLGSEPWHPDEFEAVRRFLGRETRLFNTYGVTETTVDNTVFEGEMADHPGRASVPIGRPLGNTRLWVLDGTMHPVPTGVPGELYIGGPCVAQGYLGRPELTEERFLPDPFGDASGGRLYRTGDIVRVLVDGNVEFMGRNDQQVNVRGFRIEIGESEAAIKTHPGVADGAVVVHGGDVGPGELVAYVVRAPDCDLSVRALTDFAKKRLPAHMVPSIFTFLEALPRTPSGKLDRGRLPSPERWSRHAEEDYVAPRNGPEETLAEIWRSVMEIERVGVENDFFELGGHSLMVFTILWRIEEAFGVRLAPSAFFANPTVAGLAHSILDERARRRRSP